MAAPSGISWGSIYGDYGRIGIYSKVTTSGTTATVNVQVWFWSKYTVTDANNVVYYDVGKDITEATTNCGTVNIKHTVGSGSGWSTENQTRLINKTYTYTMGKSAVTYKVYARHKNVEVVGTSMYKNATFTVPAKPSYAVKYNANGGSGAPGAQTKWYSETLKLSTTKPTRTGYTFQGWGTTATDTSVNYAAGASYTANAAITLYAIWKINTYSVKYNANGGTGAPAAQTKTYGKTLTLSSTKPTRTGYTFQGWGTSASDTSVNYTAGGSYTANAAVTLYAIWKIITYAVKYNANGGSGAPAAQTKTYGATLKLTNSVPKRDGYSFVKWNTNSAGTGTSYNSGASYTANSAVTLYAVWSLNYVKPRISSLSVTRCDANGNTSNSGTKYKLKIVWATDYSDPTLTIETKATGTNTWSSSQENLSGTSGTYEAVKPDSDTIEANTSYDIRITITDSGGYTEKTSYINSTVYPVDYLDGGKGVAFGKVAEIENVVDSAWEIRCKKNIMNGNKTGYLDGKTGVYLDDEGFIQIQRSSNNGYKPYIGFLSDDSTEVEAHVRLNPETKQLELKANGNGCLVEDGLYTRNIYLNNGSDTSAGLYAYDTSGTLKSLIGTTTGDNIWVGYGNCTKGTGNLFLYGKQIAFQIVTGPDTATALTPYINSYSSDIAVDIKTAGYVTSSGKYVYFNVPLTRPILAGTVVTARSNNGFILRQNNAYTHGSSAATCVDATYVVGVSANTGITIQATLADTTNVINNAPIGIHWSGYLSFD